MSLLRNWHLDIIIHWAVYVAAWTKGSTVYCRSEPLNSEFLSSKTNLAHIKRMNTISKGGVEQIFQDDELLSPLTPASTFYADMKTLSRPFHTYIPPWLSAGVRPGATLPKNLKCKIDLKHEELWRMTQTILPKWLVNLSPVSYLRIFWQLAPDL